MKLESIANYNHLQNGVLNIYSNHGFRTKAYAFLRLKLSPIAKISQYVPKGGTILDLGCGVGLFANILHLDSSRRSIVGVDRSVKRVETAQKVSKGNSQLKFEVGDVNNISIERCDIITVIDLLHHMPFGQQDDLLKTIYDKLNHDGIVVIKDLEKAPYWKYLFHYYQDSFSYLGSRLYFRSSEDMQNILSGIGLEIETISLASGYPHPHVLYICKK